MAGLSPRVVVLGHAAQEILAAVDLQGAEPVVCEGWREGQAASLRCGVEALGDVDAAVVVLGDQPRITAAGRRRRWRPRSRPPARATTAGRATRCCSTARLLDRAGDLRGDTGFRDLLHGVRDVEVGGLADPTDVDTPDELSRL